MARKEGGRKAGGRGEEGDNVTGRKEEIRWEGWRKGCREMNGGRGGSETEKKKKKTGEREEGEKATERKTGGERERLTRKEEITGTRKRLGGTEGVRDESVSKGKSKWRMP